MSVTQKNTLNIICLESEAFYKLLDELIDRVKAEHGIQIDKWVDEATAMDLLRISSKTTLQKYRDERRITFTQPSRKVILYDRESIEKYLSDNAQKAYS